MIFERMLVKDEKDYAAWTELASLYFNDSEFKKAESAYVKALELKNDFMAALVNLGKLYLITKEPEKATLVLTKAVMTDPGSANAFHFLGEAYLQTKQGSKAVPAFPGATNTASTPTATAALASGSMNSGWPPEAVPPAPGSCTLWVASKTTGYPCPRMIANPRMSTTRLLYPNDAPRSQTMRFSPALGSTGLCRRAASRALSTTFFMSPGARNWPFLMLTGLPAVATAQMKSV